MDVKEIVSQYFPESNLIKIEQYKNGAINVTYHLTIDENDESKDYILQKMNMLFDPSIMDDIDFITKHLASKNIVTQRVVETQEGEKFVQDGESWWRMLTYIPGKTFDFMPSSEHAREAGRLVGEFHNALIDCDYGFKFKLPHYHDVDFDIEKLKETLEENKNTDKYLKLNILSEKISDFFKKLPKISDLPKRIIHGDLKISNVLFDDNGRAVTLLDLDTLGDGTIISDLGDALRSWCMPGGEDAEEACFDKSIYDNALDGYTSSAKFLTPSERQSIPLGVQILTLDLASRFVTDALNENYFILDSLKYQTLFDQNKKRAENQLAFYKNFSENLSL